MSSFFFIWQIKRHVPYCNYFLVFIEYWAQYSECLYWNMVQIEMGLDYMSIADFNPIHGIFAIQFNSIHSFL